MFLYDTFGSLTNETVVGVAGTNTIERFYDTFGRDAGYALNGIRQSTLAYDPATGRLVSMLANGSDSPFTWDYVDGSDLKSSLAYPNGLTASWSYDANNQLLQVSNATPTNVISQYDYTYDPVGRRVACGKSGSAFAQDDTVAYGYNARSELTNAVAAVDSAYCYSYQFDDIGNRETSTERGTNSVYTANSLNQYVAVDDFVPQFDDDGNQTLIKTATGIWSVTYNGENRPILWENISTNSSTHNPTTPTLISMSYDRMGRRVTKNDQRFVYNGYLQISNSELQTSNIKLQTFVWDSTEPLATRPLVWERGNSVAYYTHDGNKNVSEVVAENGGVATHYEYAPFGAFTTSPYNSTSTAYDSRTINPFRFSSECSDDMLGLVYYNYRHYNPLFGRWCARDPYYDCPVYGVVRNCSINAFDYLGLATVKVGERIVNPEARNEYKQSFEPVGLKEGCELNFIQLALKYVGDRRWQWLPDITRNGQEQVPPLGPYYIDWSHDGAAEYKQGDARIFYDRPNVNTWFYLFVVESCCLKKYKESDKCNCCMKSRATILHRIIWHLKEGEIKVLQVNDSRKEGMDKKLKELVDGKSFPVGCVQYLNDNKGSRENLQMEMEIDYGN